MFAILTNLFNNLNQSYTYTIMHNINRRQNQPTEHSFFIKIKTEEDSCRVLSHLEILFFSELNMFKPK